MERVNLLLLLLILVLAYRLYRLQLQVDQLKPREHMSGQPVILNQDVELGGNVTITGSMNVTGDLNVNNGQVNVNNQNKSIQIGANGDQINCLKNGDGSALRLNQLHGGSIVHYGPNVSYNSASVAGKLHFRVAGDKENDDSDVYHLEKIAETNNNGRVHNRNSLRLTINDDADEALEIWGYSCATGAGCGGPGRRVFRFAADGTRSGL